MKRDLGGLARRYARALLDVAREQGSIEATARELKSAAALVDGNAELRGILLHRAVRVEKKRAIVAGIWKEGLVARLLQLLAERGRLEILSSLAEHFERAWNESRGIASGEVVSAAPLGAGQKEALSAALGRTLGLGVELKSREDPSLLGGARVSIGGRTYDGSVRAQLRALRERLAGGGA
jgi:F-type H+-transporting ATPase subunit delta